MARKRKNIINVRFGLLTVIKYSHSNRRKTVYLCKCDCGNEALIRSDLLNSGKKTNCGCINLNPPGKLSKSWKGYYDIPQVFWYMCKFGAKVRNIHFDITIEYAWDLFIKQNKKCALTGLELNFGSFTKDPSATASLDRIDSSKGYTKDNIQWVHKWINLMKLDFSQDEFIKKCHEVSNFNKTKIQEKILDKL